MELGIIIAIVGSAIGIIAIVIAMFLWLRSEANNDRRYISAIQRDDRKDILELIRSIEFEIKDFHYKLIEIERGRK
jgi:hypothetical protein